MWSQVVESRNTRSTPRKRYDSFADDDPKDASKVRFRPPSTDVLGSHPHFCATFCVGTSLSTSLAATSNASNDHAASDYNWNDSVHRHAGYLEELLSNGSTEGRAFTSHSASACGPPFAKSRRAQLRTPTPSQTFRLDPVRKSILSLGSSPRRRRESNAKDPSRDATFDGVTAYYRWLFLVA
jgi:hypothetical protein